MLKVLIVDDAMTDRVRVSGIASHWSECTILEADNGRAAMEQIEIHLPDIVLTDLHMPEMNGLELVSAMRENYPHIPVVLMTAKGSEDIAAQALQRGAASYVPKLRLADDLVDTLAHVYSTSQAAHSQSRLMHYMTTTDTTFVLPNDHTLLKLCLDKLVNMLRCVPLGDETERLRVGIALREAISNAYYHGNLEAGSEDGFRPADYRVIAAERQNREPFIHRRVTIRAAISRERAEFVIRDDGSGFDMAVLNGDDENCPRPGRGITLMQSIMDEVTFNDIGNEVRLVRNAVSHEEPDDDQGD